MLRFAGKDAAPIRDMVMESASVKQAADTLSQYLQSLADADPARGTHHAVCPMRSEVPCPVCFALVMPSSVAADAKLVGMLWLAAGETLDDMRELMCPEHLNLLNDCAKECAEAEDVIAKGPPS